MNLSNIELEVGQDVKELQHGQWMGQLSKWINDKKISEIVLPGSHDSGTSCINYKSKATDELPDFGCCLNPIVKVVGAVWSRTQQWTIREQLEHGVRYLDLRVYLDDDNIFYLIHGLEANPFYEELAAVKDFVECNPTEVVVLDMNHIYRSEEEDCVRCFREIESLFKGKLCIPPTVTPDQACPTYAEMLEAGTPVIVASADMRGQHFGHRELQAQFSWLWSSETNIVSPWANTTQIPALKMYLQETMSEPRAQCCLHVTQAILTPQLAETLLGLFVKPHNLEQLAEELRPELPGWIKEFSTLRLNVFIMDFIDRDIIRQLIDLNVSGPIPLNYGSTPGSDSDETAQFLLSK